VAVVIANYFEGSVETMLSLSVNRDVLCACVSNWQRCLSVRMFKKHEEGTKQIQPTE